MESVTELFISSVPAFNNGICNCMYCTFTLYLLGDGICTCTVYFLCTCLEKVSVTVLQEGTPLYMYLLGDGICDCST